MDSVSEWSQLFKQQEQQDIVRGKYLSRSEPPPRFSVVVLVTLLTSALPGSALSSTAFLEDGSSPTLRSPLSQAGLLSRHLCWELLSN